jgi:ubiquinone/menaquinone biosynthesis C-methylase UbiE
VPPFRDVDAFNERAVRYDGGWRGRVHHQLSDRTAKLAVTTMATPERVLDVGCGTGYLLRVLAHRYPDAERLAGVDPAPQMAEMARTCADDGRLSFSPGTVEDLHYPADTFDLIVSPTSFDHWSDQQAGLLECARVLRPGGHLVLVDHFSNWLLPTLVTSRRGKARTKRRAERLLLKAGFRYLRWRKVHAMIINAVTATKPV